MSQSITSPRRVPDPALGEQMAQHEGLVGWVVRRQRLGALSFDDALHAGRLGLWHALQGYDPTRTPCVSTYAVPAITHAVWRAVAAASPEPLALPLPSADLVDATDLSDIVHDAQVHDALYALVAALPPRLREVIRARYGLDGTLPQTFVQIGKAWGISHQRVQQLHRQALLLLAHPARSHALRLLTDHRHRDAYQQSLARQRRHARANRRHRR